MSINPYESPVIHDFSPRAPVKRRQGQTVQVPAYCSLIVVLLAGLIGGSLFLGIMIIVNASRGSGAFQEALAIAIIASFGVLMAADWLFQQQWPAVVSAVIGMLVAAPLAWMIAFGIGLQAYYMGTKGIPGSQLVFMSAYGSFFFTLSLGGWLAICLRRRTTSSVD